MKRLVVCKFGGSSLADAARFRRVAEILRRNPARKYIANTAENIFRIDKALIFS